MHRRKIEIEPNFKQLLNKQHAKKVLPSRPLSSVKLYKVKQVKTVRMMSSPSFFALFCLSHFLLVQAPYRHGDVMFGGLFSVHELQGTLQGTCGKIIYEVALPEAMIFAIDKINNDSKLLPNISIGYDIRDYCESITKATQIAYEFLQHQCATNNTHNKLGKGSIAAFIGPYETSTALVISGFLQMLNVPAISGTTTSPELSSYTYKHFYRTVPSDAILAKAVADIIEHFNWTYVAAVGVDDSFGRNGVWSVIKEAEKKNGSFCVAVTQFVPHNAQYSSIRNIVRELKRYENIRVVILKIYGATLRNFMKEVKKQDLSGRVWVLGSSTVNGVLPSDFSPLHGSIAINPHRYQDAGFKQHIETLLSNDITDKQDLPEWWSEIRALRNCSAHHDHRQKESCIQNAVQDMYSSFVPYVIDAVYSVAHALHFLTQDSDTTDNDDKQKLNIEMQDMEKLLSRVNFTGVTGKIVFDEFGDRRSAVYDIINFQKVHGADDVRIQQLKVGKWDETGRLHLDDNIRWSSKSGLFPKSECVDQCSAGTRKSTTSPCCWQCVPCPRGTINPVPGAESCTPCPRGTRSNDDNTACEDLPLVNLNHSSAGGITFLVFVVLGIVVALFSLAVICIFWNSPIVKACNRELSFALLGVILLLLSLAQINVLKPTDTICKIIYPWRYITYNLCLSLLLVKVLRVSSAFQVPILPSLTITTFSNRKQVVMVLALQAFLLILLLPWLLLDPPVIMEHIYPDHYTFIHCKAYNTLVGKSLFLLTCSFIFIQMPLSVFCYFKVRNIPENFSETKRIAFSMYIFFLSLLAYHPVEFVMFGWYVTVADCITTLLSAYGFLCCIFLPKIYFILFRPELNTSAEVRREVAQFSFGTTTLRVNPTFDSSTQKEQT